MSVSEALSRAAPAASAAVSGFRLSPQQRRLWCLQSLPGAPSYRSWCEVEIRGPLDLALLRRAWRDTVARHEILRTRFAVLPGMPLPLQAVEPPGELPLEVLDLRVPEPELEARLSLLRQHLEAAPFDPAEGPLVRLALVVTGEGEHRLLLVASGLCADADGAVRLVQELCRAAAEVGTGGEEPAQYADLAEWMNETLEGEEGIGRERWHNLDLPSGLEMRLPGEVAGRGEAYAPAVQEVWLPEETMVALSALAQTCGVAVPLILQAGWRILLGRLLGRESLIVATCCNGRNYAELEDALGLFARHLPISFRADETLTVAHLLERLRETVTDAAEWQESFAWEDGGSAPPFADLAFSSWALPRWQVGELSCAVVRLGALLDRSALALGCADSGSLELRYDTARLPASVVERLGERLVTLVSAMATHRERRIGDLELLSPAERRRLLVELNRTAAPLEGRPVQVLFAEAARRDAAAPAVVAGERVLTFGELDRRSSQLAWFLRARGVQPETRVGILLERSCELVVALLGVLKAGGPMFRSIPPTRQIAWSSCCVMRHAVSF